MPNSRLLGEWSLKALAGLYVLVAIMLVFSGHFFVGTLIGALAVLQYLAAFMFKVEVRSPVVPVAMVATAISGLLLWRTNVWLGIGSLATIALAGWAFMNLPRR